MLTDGEGYSTGVDGLTVQYVPNLRPNPKWRKDPQLKNLGRSDISPDLIPLFDKVDEWWSSLSDEFDIGQGRLFIPEELLDSRGPGKGSMFNTDRKAYTLTAGAGNDEQTIHAEQFEIRVTEHLEAIEALVREILRRVGYSPGTFGLVDDGGAMTATEVAAKRAASTATKTAKGRLWQAALAPLLRTLLEVDAIQFGTGAEVLEDVDVEWPAAYKDTDLVRAQTVQAMDVARAVSTYQKVAYLHPDWDAQAIQDEADAILSENTVADPFAMAPDVPVDPIEPDPAEEPADNPFDNAA
jgi:A118 family predicted phage portal protein